MPTQEFHDAVITRFNDDDGGGDSSQALPTVARKLYIGFQDGREVNNLPYVEFHMLTDSTLDGFTSDVEGGLYQFTMYTDSNRPNAAYEIRKNIIRVFDNAQIAEPTPGATFTSVAFERESGGNGPQLVNGVYQSSLLFNVLIQLTTMNPATRYT